MSRSSYADSADDADDDADNDDNNALLAVAVSRMEDGEEAACESAAECG